jgi:RNA polymerase sigma factor (sigma-70 family)
MEASAVNQTGAAGLHGRSPLLRLQSDERLIALIRRGNPHAFEALVARYQSRLLAFCRHMLSSKEDAEDVLQEVFAAAYNAILADEREINVRPWLYRIARNRSLNHLRRATAVGVDSMDVHLSEGGLTTADKVHKREEFRLLIADVQDLPETQRTALLLREIDALSYEQIAEAMETTVPSVKSLLVRARVSLAEAAEARLLSCDEVRVELGAVSEGLMRTTAPVRRHLRSCDRCGTFRKQLRQNNRALAALYPVGPLFLLKKTILAQLGASAAASGSTAAAGGAAGAAGAAAGGALQAGMTTLATKAVAGLAAAAIVTAGAVEVKHVAEKPRGKGAETTLAAAAAPKAPEAAAAQASAPVTVRSAPQPAAAAPDRKAGKPAAEKKADGPRDEPLPKIKLTPVEAGKEGEEGKEGKEGIAPNTEQHDGDTSTLPTETTGLAEEGNGSLGAGAYQPPALAAQPAPTTTTPSSEPAPNSAQPIPTPEPTPPAATATPTPDPTATPTPEDPAATATPTPG